VPHPHNEFAIISGRRAITVPTVDAPITAGHLQILGFSSRAQAQNLLRTVPSH
jgi:hypothetical protein